ncbi:hypothetical protein [Burkholderia sp. BCC1999]|uniref:hypothetical protein n=1 Tax=Burkholderia sp. BCC1999 TaxID=2817448 RepID=UPI002AC367D5|nr:hypothetical protein [Burkholderia sp. BCC1999]
MKAIDINFKIFGFKPGDRVYLNVNDVTRTITITPDYSQLALREQPYHVLIGNRRRYNTCKGRLMRL